jgi:TrmH family RNA methyltransferase
MPVRIVQSKQNARLKELRRALNRPGRDEQGLAGIEGPNLLAEALRAGLHVPCVFATQENQALLKNLPLPAATEILLMSLELLESALGTETPQPIAALVEPPDWTWAHVLGTRKKSPALVIVLAGVQDPGNLGTILRSAEAFGADGVLSLPGTVSAWNQKALRASAGSTFRLPLINASVKDCMENLREAGVKTFATTVSAGEPADLVDLAGPVALLIGNEGNGIPKELAGHADGTITIPCPGAVESLNAAVAASILLYEAARQRSTKSGGPQEHRGSAR